MFLTYKSNSHGLAVVLQEREARRDEKIRYTCKCSFLEIYNEQILDLLDPSSANLQVAERILEFTCYIHLTFEVFYFILF